MITETIMLIEDKQEELIEELSIIEDPQERLAYVIDRARGEPGLSDAYKIEQFRIEGCVSNLWMVPTFKDGRCGFKADSDAVITKGIANLLTTLYSGCTPVEIITHEPDFLAEVGITQHLSPNRRNGLSNVWAKIKAFAELCKDAD